MIYFHTQRRNLSYIGLGKNIISNQRDQEDDQVTTNPVAINDTFKCFYINLYKAETDFDEPICKQYLDAFVTSISFFLYATTLSPSRLL